MRSRRLLSARKSNCDLAGRIIPQKQLRDGRGRPPRGNRCAEGDRRFNTSTGYWLRGSGEPWERESREEVERREGWTPGWTFLWASLVLLVEKDMQIPSWNGSEHHHLAFSHVCSCHISMASRGTSVPFTVSPTSKTWAWFLDASVILRRWDRGLSARGLMAVVPAARTVGGHVGLCCSSSFPLLGQCPSPGTASFREASVQVAKPRSCSTNHRFFTPPSLSSSFVQETLDDLGQEKRASRRFILICFPSQNGGEKWATFLLHTGIRHPF